MSLVEAVERDLASYPPELAQSGLAATAIAMADRIDGGRGSPSECAKALMEALRQLRELRPPEERKGKLHDLKSERALRLVEGRAGT